MFTKVVSVKQSINKNTLIKRLNSSSSSSNNNGGKTLNVNSSNPIQHINDSISNRFWPSFKMSTATNPINKVPDTLASYDTAIDFNPSGKFRKNIYIPKIYDSENVLDPIKNKLKNNKIVKTFSIQELTTDPGFLSQFLWDSGEIKPREFTKLTRENHTKIVKSIVWCRKQNILSTRHKFYQ
ncbi:hypothetical protein ACO0SA_001523 [Hanseniaspora valbyensis]